MSAPKISTPGPNDRDWDPRKSCGERVAGMVAVVGALSLLLATVRAAQGQRG